MRELSKTLLQEAAERRYPAQCPECKQRGRTKDTILHGWPCVPYMRRSGDA